MLESFFLSSHAVAKLALLQHALAEHALAEVSWQNMRWQNMCWQVFSDGTQQLLYTELLNTHKYLVPPGDWIFAQSSCIQLACFNLGCTAFLDNAD